MLSKQQLKGTKNKLNMNILGISAFYHDSTICLLLILAEGSAVAPFIYTLF
jgi:hypothetical protein